MSLSTIIAGAAIDIGKKYLLDAEKKVAHDFADSVTGKRIGVIIDYRQQEGNNNVLLFVHGFSGSSSETFGATPDILVNDAKFKGWDVFSIGYSTDVFPSIGKGLWSVNPDITKVALYLNTLLKNEFARYDRIAFVAHSMGGLAVQRVILDAEQQFRKKLSHVIFFGTPSAGLRKARFFSFWNTDLKDLSDRSDFIKKLRNDWSETFNGKFPFTFKTIAGSKDEFVPTSSSLEPFDKGYWGVIEGNHITMIKPKDISDVNNQSFAIIAGTLAGENIDYLVGDPEQINILMGKYYAIVTKYYDKAKELALEPLKDLVFALECTGRKEDALRVLQEHPEVMGDPDALGIIGGRFKRKYLVDGLQDDLDNAFKYYKDALTLSENKKDREQIYYQAINLAFLSLAGNRDKMQMKEYAQLSNDNCDPATGNVWELATIAEAKLYLDDISGAEEFYRKAAQPGVNARTKGSIYSNAYYGYIALTGNTTSKDAFLKMLEEIFLS